MLDRMPEKLANRTPDKMSEDIYQIDCQMKCRMECRIICQVGYPIKCEIKHIKCQRVVSQNVRLNAG